MHCLHIYSIEISYLCFERYLCANTNISIKIQSNLCQSILNPIFPALVTFLYSPNTAVTHLQNKIAWRYTISSLWFYISAGVGLVSSKQLFLHVNQKSCRVWTIGLIYLWNVNKEVRPAENHRHILKVSTSVECLILHFILSSSFLSYC